MTVLQDIAAAQQEAHDWLIDVAAPFWSKTGRTPSGLFAERLTLDGVPDESYYRVFVQARQLFSIVQAGRAGWKGPWQDLVAQTIATLVNKARRPDGFFVHRLDVEANPLDSRADLYDQAFVLLALGTAGGALDDASLYDAAEALLDVIEAQWAHPQGGFAEGEIVDPSIRRQNPHMHLLEALSALYSASGRQRFQDAAYSIAQLCEGRFIDPSSGALLEYFDDAWSPVSGRAGKIAEPGHCFEWAWLFERLAIVGWSHGTVLSNTLSGFGRRYGLDHQRSVAINEVLTDGEIVDGTARLWPQTERLKAGVARFARGGLDEDAGELLSAWRGLKQYMLPSNPALWRDKLTVDGTFLPELAPGSSFYHISCAIVELINLNVAR